MLESKWVDDKFEISVSPTYIVNIQLSPISLLLLVFTIHLAQKDKNFDKEIQIDASNSNSDWSIVLVNQFGASI